MPSLETHLRRVPRSSHSVEARGDSHASQRLLRESRNEAAAFAAVHIRVPVHQADDRDAVDPVDDAEGAVALVDAKDVRVRNREAVGEHCAGDAAMGDDCDGLTSMDFEDRREREERSRLQLLVAFAVRELDLGRCLHPPAVEARVLARDLVVRHALEFAEVDLAQSLVENRSEPVHLRQGLRRLLRSLPRARVDRREVDAVEDSSETAGLAEPTLRQADVERSVAAPECLLPRLPVPDQEQTRPRAHLRTSGAAPAIPANASSWGRSRCSSTASASSSKTASSERSARRPKKASTTASFSNRPWKETPRTGPRTKPSPSSVASSPGSVARVSPCRIS